MIKKNCVKHLVYFEYQIEKQTKNKLKKQGSTNFNNK